MGKVDEVAHDHFFLRATVAEMVDIVVDLGATAAKAAVHRRAIPRPARQRPQGRDPDPRILRPPRRHVAARRSAPHQQASARSVSPAGGHDRGGKFQEENRPRWGVRTSNPGGAASRSLVGSTPSLFRHPRAHEERSGAMSRHRRSSMSSSSRPTRADGGGRRIPPRDRRAHQGAGDRTRLRVPPAQSDARDRRSRRRRRRRGNRGRRRHRRAARQARLVRATARRATS